MATDHRGRPLHAGKRTVQETQNWVSAPLDPDEPTTGGAIHTTSTEDHDLEVYEYPGGKKSNWKVEASMGYDYPAGFVDLGRGKSSLKYHGNGFSYSSLMEVGGTTRTPKRAMIAAEAMSNRIKEGRNLKTGRPLE